MPNMKRRPAEDRAALEAWAGSKSSKLNVDQNQPRRRLTGTLSPRWTWSDGGNDTRAGKARWPA